MTYSKRQLYALGETLGDSVTQRKVGGGYVCGGGGGGGGIAGSIHAEPLSYTPSQGFVNQGTPAPDPIIAGPEAAPTPVATQGVQSSFGATTNATQQPTQPQNPFTGGLGGYGYRYGDPGQQQMQQPQPQNPYGSYGGNPYMGNPYGNGNYGGGGGQQYGGLMGILQHLFGGQGQQPPSSQPSYNVEQSQQPQVVPLPSPNADTPQADSMPMGGQYA